MAVWLCVVLSGMGCGGGLSLVGSKPPKTAKAPTVTLNVVMKKYAVVPDVITVKRGTLVHLHVTTPDVQHGFDIPDLNISEPVNPGKPADITFVADKPGTYRIECGIICGPGHDDMTGKLVVE